MSNIIVELTTMGTRYIIVVSNALASHRRFLVSYKVAKKGRLDIWYHGAKKNPSTCSDFY